MIEFSLHPEVYATGSVKSLLRMLEKIWVQDHTPGQGTIYIMSGFGTYNGGVRFFDAFENHTNNGGRIVCFFAGSTAQRLTSKQLVQQLLKAGAEVHIVNRKRLLHAKCYGTSSNHRDTVIVTSGNFTGPGLSQNIEAAILIDSMTTNAMSFSWTDLESSIRSQRWDRYALTLTNPTDPGWRLLYDEQSRTVTIDETEELTLLLTLVPNDVSRIVAPKVGSQYFFLSRDCYGFFPPLTLRNRRGSKSTFSCLINLHYIPLRATRRERVTFESGNNLDFRLGTGLLRNTGIASVGDIAAISRTSEDHYELRIIHRNDPNFTTLRSYAINMIGNRGKQYGFIDNDDFTQITGYNLPSVPRAGFP